MKTTSENIRQEIAAAKSQIYDLFDRIASNIPVCDDDGPDDGHDDSWQFANVELYDEIDLLRAKIVILSLHLWGAR